MNFITLPYKEIVTAEQYANAQTHWVKLIAGQISGRFSMALFNNREAYTKISAVNICGTSACSAGYLPETLRIPFDIIVKRYVDGIDIDYVRPVKDYLGINEYWELLHAQEWQWCFDIFWMVIDNTAKGAGIRMRILYEQGLPGNWKQQFQGIEDLMYKDEL